MILYELQYSNFRMYSSVERNLRRKKRYSEKPQSKLSIRKTSARSTVTKIL